MPASATPSTTANVVEAARAAVAAVNVALPATIVSYDHEEQRATIRLVPCRRRRGSDGSVECYRPPDIPGVPVAFPGTGSFGLTWPLAVGDSGMAVFSDRSMDEWLSEGGTESEPQDQRRHDLTDAVFVPGLRSFAEAVPSAGRDATAMVLRGDEIRLGDSTASDFVALASLVESELQALWTALQTHVHGGVTTGAGVSAATVYPGVPGSVAADKVKAT